VIEVLRLLNAIGQDVPRHSWGYYTRHLDPKESIPQFGHGIPDHPLVDREWIWIAYKSSNDQPVALIAAAPYAGVAMLMRIYATEDAPKSVFVGMLRKSLADIRARGYNGYITYLSPEKEREVGLSKMVMRAGGQRLDSAILYCGSTDISMWGK